VADGVAGAVTGVVARLDAWQQRHRLPGFLYAVVKKYGDDRAGQHASLLAYYAFLSTFPLLLVFVSVLGMVLKNDPELRQRVIESGLGAFPVIGDQLRASTGSLDGSGVALVIGLVVTFFGARGLADTAQSAFNDLWAVPYVRRPGFVPALGRSLAMLLVVGLAAVSTGFVATVVAGTTGTPPWTRVLLLVAGLALSLLLFGLGFRLATAREVAWRHLWPGAVVAAVAWQVLLAVGSLVVAHLLANANAVYGAFATVIGLLAWFALQAQITLYAVELDIVLARGLWPRSLRNPPLADADRVALRSYAAAQQRLDGQRVSVTFADEVVPAPPEAPGPEPRRRRRLRTLAVAVLGGAAAGAAATRALARRSSEEAPPEDPRI
jgi:YihY family inner membrane protein